MFKKNPIILFTLLFCLIFFLPGCGGRKAEPIKDHYSVQDILAEVKKNYSGIKTVQMDFSDQMKMTDSISNLSFSVLQNGELFHVQNGGLKANQDEVELVVDRKMGIIGNYKGKQEQAVFNHMAQWIGVVYKMILLIPGQFQEIARYKEVKSEKSSGKGYYTLHFPAGDDGIVMDAEVDVSRGTVEKLKIVQTSLIRDMRENLTFAPYEIEARLGKFKAYGNSFFPREIKASYKGREGLLTFDSRIKGVKFNRNIREEDLSLSAKSKKGILYRDPFWIDSLTLVLVKLEGDYIRNEYGQMELINKNYYLVRKEVDSGKEEVLRHLLFSPDKGYVTRFVMTGNYCPAHNRIAFAISEKPFNENKDLKKITGVYIMDLKNKQNVIKVSEKGFDPLWSGNGGQLIWNEAREGKKYNEINDVWICDKDGKEKKNIIQNGFHYSWGSRDETLVVERGFWGLNMGYIKPNDPAVAQGISLYRITDNSLEQLVGHGFNPRLSSSKRRMVFTDYKQKSGIYLMDLENRMVTTAVKFKEFYDILAANWSNNDDALIYVFSACDADSSMKCGLYKYLFADNSNKLLSQEIGFTGMCSSYLDYSIDGKYLLYKFYQEPHWETYTWGLFNVLSERIDLRF
ncbi:MAG: hypothetical protein PHF84_04020 [bacterium]|nr:hypothetical protein [bacterium]